MEDIVLKQERQKFVLQIIRVEVISYWSYWGLTSNCYELPIFPQTGITKDELKIYGYASKTYT